MTAAAIALAGVCALLAAANITLGVWLHSAHGRERNALDVIDSERKLSAQYMHERDVAVAELTVAKKQLATEQDLRARVEAARNEAQRKLTEHLAKKMETATNEEIQSVVTDVFSSPLLPGSVPNLPALRRPASDDLIDPRTEV